MSRSYFLKIEGLVDCKRVTNYNSTGDIPKAICHLTMLQWLSLNNFNGSLPKEIGNITHLGYLWLNDNNLSEPDVWMIYILTGEIPKENSLLNKLVQWNNAKNRLQGSLPREIGNRSAQDLWLDFNELTGMISYLNTFFHNIETHNEKIA
ncbi:hypothetical protein SASPL_136800 [Salvia splendens]|uniref:Uncharacterized protein n=1 Tax=Salvia splendens TaxID=180675 RepID=A0A8X8X2X1_SALSN|nr:hypothetical protein SASPL_136800 [Salvia splendens]